MQIHPVARNYPAGLLAAVLLCEKAQLRESRRLGVAVNAKDAALFVKFIRKAAHQNYFNRAGASIARDGNDIFSMLSAPLRGLTSGFSLLRYLDFTTAQKFAFYFTRRRKFFDRIYV